MHFSAVLAMTVVTAAAALTLLLHLAYAKVDIKQIYESPLSHGFGDDIAWVKWEDAIETAMEQDKPIFLLIHKSWCHACKALKKTFQQSNAKKAFKMLSEYFVMVNTEDDDEPYEEEYRPDGKYIPRLLFLEKNGDLLPDIKNKKAEYKTYAYYYSSVADVLISMKDVLELHGVEVPELKRAEKSKAARKQKIAAKKQKAEKEDAAAKEEAEKTAKELEEKAAKKAEEEKKKVEEEKKKVDEEKKTEKKKPEEKKPKKKEEPKEEKKAEEKKPAPKAKKPEEAEEKKEADEKKKAPKKEGKTKKDTKKAKKTEL